MSSKPLRVRSVLAPLLAVAAVGGWAGSAPATEGSPTMVEIEADRFEPDRVEIEAGATVEWRNIAASSRSVTADDGSFSSGRLRPGESFLVSFAEPGEYAYHGAGGGRTPSSPAGLVVVHALETIGQEEESPGEDPDPSDDQPHGEDPEDPTDLGTPPPTEQAAPAPGQQPPWEDGSEDPGTQAGRPTAFPVAPAPEPLSAGRSAVVTGQAQEGVTIVDNAYQPKQVEIDPGTTVVWTQVGQLPHTVTADDGSFDSGEMGQGDTYSRTFQQPGSYPYYCTFHGAPGGQGMAGTVVVTGSPRGPGGGGDEPGAAEEGEDEPGAALAETGTSVVALFLLALALMTTGITLLLADRRSRSLVPTPTGFEKLGPAPLSSSA